MELKADTRTVMENNEAFFPVNPQWNWKNHVEISGDIAKKSPLILNGIERLQP